jgi:PAS domain S-box-containing protein
MGQAAVSPVGRRARQADRLPESPLPMWIFHIEGGAIVAANEAATRAYGYTLDELLACRLGDLFPDEVGMLTELLGRASPWTGTFRQRRKDGGTFEVDAAMIDMGGTGPTAIMVIACPVTPGRREGT